MRRVWWRELAAAAVIVGSVSDCAQLALSSESDASITPPTVPDTTATETTVTETTAEADPCAEFEALLDYQCMMAVKRARHQPKGSAGRR